MIAALNACTDDSPAEILESVRISVDAFSCAGQRLDEYTQLTLIAKYV